jgi:tetratricopeptide (TPR) repeat protein
MEKIGLLADSNLPEHLHRVTLGVPLAVGTLLNLHRYGDSVLSELGAIDVGDGAALEGTNAWRHVVEVVASRFLLHLEKRPEAAEDFRDNDGLLATATAGGTARWQDVAPRTSRKPFATGSLCRTWRTNRLAARNRGEEILQKYWGTAWPTNCLRDLAQRYALLADGDLHPTVRTFLRRHWRVNPPRGLSTLAKDLHEVFLRIESPQPELSASRASWILNDLNLLVWSEGELALPRFSRALAIFLANKWDLSALIKLAEEIPVSSASAKSFQVAFLMNTQSYAFEIPKTSLQWLERQVNAEWAPEERGCLDLVLGLTFARDSQHAAAVQRFESGFERLASAIPRRDSFAQAYLNSVVALSKQREDIQLVNRALVWAEKASVVEAEVWNDEYFALLHSALRYEEAEAYCRRVIVRDPLNLSARAHLGHIIAAHLDRPEEAEKEYRAGLEIDPKDQTLHYFLGMQLDLIQRFKEAEDQYREALKGLYDIEGRVRILSNLALLYSKHVDRFGEAELAFQELEALIGEDTKSRLLNSLAWNFYLGNSRLELAEEWARAAVDKEPNNVAALHTLTALQIRRNRWIQALPNLRRWLREVECEYFRKVWSDFHPMFHDALKCGRGIEVADIILLRIDHSQWRVLEFALRLASDQVVILSGQFEALSSDVHQVVEDLKSDHVTRPFPHSKNSRENSGAVR